MRTKKTDDGYFVSLERGEKILESLSELVSQESIPSATVTGLGAVKNSRLGFYHLSSKRYDERFFPEDAELVALVGNISWLDERPVIHCHLTLATADFQAYAGHLFEAEIAVVGEFYISVKDTRVERRFSNEIGLNLLDL